MHRCLRHRCLRTNVSTVKNIKTHRDVRTGESHNSTPPLLPSSCKACHVYRKTNYRENFFVSLLHSFTSSTAQALPVQSSLLNYQTTDSLGPKHSLAFVTSYTIVLTTWRCFAKAYTIPLLCFQQLYGLPSYPYKVPPHQASSLRPVGPPLPPFVGGMSYNMYRGGWVGEQISVIQYVGAVRCGGMVQCSVFLAGSYRCGAVFCCFWCSDWLIIVFNIYRIVEGDR